jgi:GAF domain-containing protein
VPLLREGVAIGVICAFRLEPRAFSPQQIALLETFAAQAVIAIENARLFNELREKNGALTEALEQQTATAEILRVISSSPTDLQPVFDAIVRSTLELCDAKFCVAYRYDGAQLHVVAHDNLSPETLALLNTRYPQPPSGETATGVSVLERRIVHIPDATTAEGVPPGSYAFARAQGWASLLAVPLLRDGQPIGNIAVARVERGPFSEQQIALVQTFADQAVIAIENVRLLRELQARTEELTRSVEQLTALGEVGRAVSSTLDLQTVLGTIVARATQLAAVDAGIIYEYDERHEVFEPRATHQLEDEIVRALEASPIRKGDGATGRLAEVSEPIQLADIRVTSMRGQAREALLRAGYRALLAVPLLREEQLIGGLTVFRKVPGEYAPDVVELLRAFATQSALAIQNARLFREIEDKSRELEAASRHKSEFLANMSHELRTPLNAIIGFSEVLTERMFGELNDKQDEYLRDIYASGQHMLSLINDILDLSKVEAGRMELELSDFDLPMAIDNALTLVRERAGRRGIALAQSIGEGVGAIRADERKVRQVLLNLLSNALKFTPEGGSR